MTQDEIIQTLHKVVAENQNFTTWTVSTPHLVGLVNAAIAKEREACAKEADEYANQVFEHNFSKLIAHNIRARKQA